MPGEEAVVRIILQDQGGGGDGGAPQRQDGGAAPGGGGAPNGAGGPPQPAGATGQPRAFAAGGGRFAPGGALARGDPGYEAYIEALVERRKEREDVLQDVDELYHERYPTPEAQFDPKVEAQRQIDAEERRASVDVERRALEGRPSREEEKEAAERALEERRIEQLYLAHYNDELKEELRSELSLRKKQEKEAAEKALEARKIEQLYLEHYNDELKEELRSELSLRKKQKAEEQRINQLYLDALQEQIRQELIERDKAAKEAANTPAALAQKRRESERKAAQVDAAYEQQYGGRDKESGLDRLLDVADRLRGTIGGLAGTLVGAALDIAAGFRKAQVETDKNKQKADLLAEGTTAKAGAAAVDVGEAAGISGAAIAGVAIAAVAVISAFKALYSEADKMAKVFGELNPDIASAQAQQEVIQTLGDIRRAGEIAPQMSQFIRAQTDMTQRYEELKVQFMRAALPILTTIMDAVTGLMQLPEVIGTGVATAISSVGTAISGSINDVNNTMRDLNVRDPQDPTTVLWMNPGQVNVPAE